MMARQMKDSGVEWIGEIPENWECVKIKQLADRNVENSFVDGDWIESPYIEDVGIRYLTTGNIGDGVYKNQGNGYISLKTFDLLGCKYAYPDDLVFSRLNSPYGRSCILPHDFDKYVLAVDNVILRPLNNVIKRYVCFFSQCKGYQENVFDFAKGTTMKRISRSNLGNVFILLPSKEEQQKIADFLDEKVGKIDSVISKTKETIEDYKKYKQAIITETVTKGLNPDVEMKDSEIDYLGTIPCDWKIIPISIAFDFIGGYAYKSEKFYNEATSYQVIRLGNVKNDNFIIDEKCVFIDEDYAKESEKCRIYENDILFTMTGTKGKKDYFYTLIVKKKDLRKRELFLNQRVGCFRKATDKVFMPYYNYLLKYKNICDYIFLSETGTANQGNIGIESINTTKLLLPPLDEQKEIVDYLDEKCSEIDKLIAKKEELLTDLENYKKSLIYEYVTGKKEVQ